MSDENKPAEPAYRTAAEVYDVHRDRGSPTPGLSASPGLRELDDSRVPGVARSHVVGPQQSAVDPVLAGLDMGYNPLTRTEDRVITRTLDGAMVVPPPDKESDAIVGPSGTSAPPAEGAAAEAARVTPTAIAVGTQPQPEPASNPVA